MGLGIIHLQTRRESSCTTLSAFVLHNLITYRLIPWIFEAPACHGNQVSVLHLDEYVLLLSKPGAKHKKGVQWPFEALSSKPTSWVYFMVDLEDMPSVCPHPMRKWYCASTVTAAPLPGIPRARAHAGTV